MNIVWYEILKKSVQASVLVQELKDANILVNDNFSYIEYTKKSVPNRIFTATHTGLGYIIFDDQGSNKFICFND